MLCLVLWQSVVLAKKNARPGFGHFEAVRVRSAVEGKCMLPLASRGLLPHAIKVMGFKEIYLSLLEQMQSL